MFEGKGGFRYKSNCGGSCINIIASSNKDDSLDKEGEVGLKFCLSYFQDIRLITKSNNHKHLLKNVCSITKDEIRIDELSLCFDSFTFSRNLPFTFNSISEPQPPLSAKGKDFS